ncbi:unnamed protein product, partial [Chrysoparadoxa australica]
MLPRGCFLCVCDFHLCLALPSPHPLGIKAGPPSLHAAASRRRRFSLDVVEVDNKKARFKRKRTRSTRTMAPQIAANVARRSSAAAVPLRKASRRLSAMLPLPSTSAQPLPPLVRSISKPYITMQGSMATEGSEDSQVAPLSKRVWRSRSFSVRNGCSRGDEPTDDLPEAPEVVLSNARQV